jgi:hypothetical protein
MIYAQKQRLEKLHDILLMISEYSLKSIGLEESKLISLICFRHGATAKKAKEYIQDLINVDKIFKAEKDGLIWTK